MRSIAAEHRVQPSSPVDDREPSRSEGHDGDQEDAARDRAVVDPVAAGAAEDELEDRDGDAQAEVDQRECDERDGEDAAQHVGRDVRPGSRPPSARRVRRCSRSSARRRAKRAADRGTSREPRAASRGRATYASGVFATRSCIARIPVIRRPSRPRTELEPARQAVGGSRRTARASPGRQGGAGRVQRVRAARHAGRPRTPSYSRDHDRRRPFPAAMTPSPAVAQRKRCGRVWRRYFPTM